MNLVFPLPILIILLVVLAALSFLFSASETSIISMNRIRLRHMAMRGIKGAQFAQRLVSHADKFISAILVGNNFVNISISALITAVMVTIFGYRWGVVIATFTSTFFILILCEITPKMLAIRHTEKVALFTAPFMELFIKVFGPIIYLFSGAADLVLRMLNLQPQRKPTLVTEEELRMMVEIGREEGVLTDQEWKMLHRVFEFGDTKVCDVMMPKDQIIAVSVDANPEKLLDIFSEEGHSRLPVYRDSLDQIEGVIYARDLLYVLRDHKLFLLQDLLHPAFFVLGTMKVSELLIKFQTMKIQIAIVTDEKKSTLGVVTLEDLIEEIVGEIEEDHGR